MRINIANSSGEINILIFNDVNRAYRKYFRKRYLIDAEFIPLFTGTNCALILTSGLQGSVNVHRGTLLLVPQWQCISSFVFYILLIVAEKSNFEIRNDVIRAYRKYFRKSCLSKKCVKFDSVLPATNCASISLTVPELLSFEGTYDVIFVNRKKPHKNVKSYVVFDMLLKANLFLFLMALVSSKSDKK